MERVKEDILNWQKASSSLGGWPDWDSCLYHACRGGHRDVAEWAMEKGADDGDESFYAMLGACEGGRRDMMYFTTVRTCAHTYNFSKYMGHMSS